MDSNTASPVDARSLRVDVDALAAQEGIRLIAHPLGRCDFVTASLWTLDVPGRAATLLLPPDTSEHERRLLVAEVLAAFTLGGTLPVRSSFPEMDAVHRLSRRLLMPAAALAGPLCAMLDGDGCDLHPLAAAFDVTTDDLECRLLDLVAELNTLARQ